MTNASCRGRGGINSFLQKHKIVLENDETGEKYKMIEAGIQLGYLYIEDVRYIASKDTSVIQASNRLAQRRREAR